METNHYGKQSFRFRSCPSVLSSAAVGGKMESEGPLAPYFDVLNPDTKFGEKTWEKAESRMQETALAIAEQKARLKHGDLDLIFAGDLLNQCVGSSFSLRETGIPFFGLYGACSTMAESLLLASLTVDGGYARRAAALTSSHFAGAERQYRFPLGYGGQRTPTAQWTVTGSGCMLIQQDGQGPYICSATAGHIVDYGIKDASNMGAAMAVSAYHTLCAHFDDLHLSPEDYDLILTGDLGAVGRSIVEDFFARDGVHLGTRYQDCGCLIYDPESQDVHAGGSGCGCGAVTLCGYVMRLFRERKVKHVLFCGTGALLSPLSTQQGESIPGICHAVSLSAERR